MNIESRTTPVLTPLVRGLNKAIVASQLKVVQEGALPDLEQGSYVLAPTHQHALDASVLLAMQPGDWRVMAAVERFQGPEAPLLRAVGAYPIDRDKPAPASIKETFRLMKEGTEVVMFPEGEIHTDGQVHDFKPGVARLSLKGGVDAIVPMALAYRDEMRSPIVPALLGAGLAGAAWVGAQLSGAPLLRGLAAAGGLGLAGAALGKKLSGPAIDPNDVRFVSLMAKQIGYATAGLLAGAVGGALLPDAAR